MFSGEAAATMGGVMIRIRVHASQPPCGWAGADGGPAEAFAGWLQLLEILGRLVGGEPGSAPPSGGGGGHLDARGQAQLG